VRILLDTNLLIRAAITPNGLAREILRLIEASDDHVLLISSYLFGEVVDVLRRDRIRARWPLSDEDIRLYCHYLSTAGEEVSPQPLSTVIRDPKDQAIIETAVAGTATAICTNDSHFYEPAAVAFCASRAIRVVKDVELLQLLRTG
jgi:uncharacterized protein